MNVAAPEPRHSVQRLSGEDLAFWWMDSPMQPTTMAMLMLLDRTPEPVRLRRAFDRTIDAVPRLRQRVVEAPLGLTLPRWETDPIFEFDYHVRRHAVPGTHDLNELFREIAPAYETPFDRSRPLWEARLYEGLNGDHQAALFFKLHHAVADGVGANAIFAAMTDWERDPAPQPRAAALNGIEAEPAALGMRLVDALRDRFDLERQRVAAVGAAVLGAVQHPERIRRGWAAVRSLTRSLRFEHQLSLPAFGRARRLSGMALPFAQVHELKRALNGCMIDVLLTIMAGAMERWQARHGRDGVRELMTLVPVNLRKPEEWTEQAAVGNVATGILVALPLWRGRPLAAFREISRRMAEKKADPASAASPALAEMLTVLPPPLISWLNEGSFGTIDFIVTNVPGILATRYLAGSEIVAAYPFAPVAAKSPASVALYGYRDSLFIGVCSDEAAMPDVDRFARCIAAAFADLRAAAGVRARPRHAAKSRAAHHATSRRQRSG